MKPTKLTLKILRDLEPSDIIYAEFASGGAMGACATARIFTIDQGKLVFYLADAIRGQADEAAWGATYNKLHTLAERGLIDEAYAGLGNAAWKSREAEFRRDDDHASFIYSSNNQEYHIPASVVGVYSHLVASFAKRDVDLADLEKYIREKQDHLTDEEHQFAYAYLDYCKQVDSGASEFDLTIEDYLGAMAYIRHLSGEEYILNPSDLADCQAALQKYRLRYISEKIGWNKLNKFFADLVATDNPELFNKLSQLIDEPVSKLLLNPQTIESNCTELDVAEPQNIAALFAYHPVLVDFTAKANAKIIDDIQRSTPNKLHSNAGSIAFYLANYLLHEDKWPLSDILPVAVHIVMNLPLDDVNGAHADQLLWAAGEIINDAWKFIEESPEVQQKYRDLVYGAYWPRIGSLWPIEHYDKFEFKDETTDKMFNDILSFIISLDDLAERNPDFKDYLKDYTPKKQYSSEMLRRKAFSLSLEGLSPREQFDRVMAFEPSIAWFYLTYPEDTEEAKLLLDEIFKPEDDNKFTTPCKFATLENLILTPNTMGVGEYILDYLDDHFDDLVQLVLAAENDHMGLDYDPERVLEDLFIAMTRGVSEENEFPPLKSIADKLIKRGGDKAKIESALAYARRRRRTTLFQRSALKKFF